MSEGSAGPASPSSATLAAASRRSRSVRRLQDTQAASPAPKNSRSPTALGKTTWPHHTNCCYQGPSTDRPFCQDGDLSAFLPSTLQKNVEPHGTADTASLYLVTPDLQECCERLDKAAIVSAVDGDAGGHGRLVYSLKGDGVRPNATLSYFFIDPDTGALSLLKPLDRDPPSGRSRWRLQVGASDRHSQAVTVVLVNVKDINDNAPFFPEDTLRASVLENSPKDL
ncbi:Neural-cadherin [Chionoecetes opilio]|uniref:Neural-cadherin n=1 Tax=Chionoecetes opilio TaxID=41210 RepID=A0A8J4XQL3_CHIOP|nr:Neural-cadherin [Chionoecetes opilio]